MPALIKSERRFGSVQKQKMSGLTALARARASVLICGLPSLGAAASSRRFVDVADAGDLETGVGVKGGGVVHARACPCRRR